MNEKMESEIAFHLGTLKNGMRTLFFILLVLSNLAWPFADFKTAATISGLGGALALWAFVGSLGDPRNHPMLVALRDKPETILHVYLLSVNGGANVVAMVVEGGTRYTIPAEQSQHEEYMQRIAQIAPHAKIGYVPGVTLTTREELEALKKSEEESAA